MTLFILILIVINISMLIFRFITYLKIKKQKKIYTNITKSVNNGIIFNKYDCRFFLQIQIKPQEIQEVEYRFSFNYN